MCNLAQEAKSASTQGGSEARRDVYIGWLFFFQVYVVPQAAILVIVLLRHLVVRLMATTALPLLLHHHPHRLATISNVNKAILMTTLYKEEREGES